MPLPRPIFLSTPTENSRRVAGFFKCEGLTCEEARDALALAYGLYFTSTGKHLYPESVDPKVWTEWDNVMLVASVDPFLELVAREAKRYPTGILAEKLEPLDDSGLKALLSDQPFDSLSRQATEVLVKVEMETDRIQRKEAIYCTILVVVVCVLWATVCIHAHFK